MLNSKLISISALALIVTLMSVGVSDAVNGNFVKYNEMVDSSPEVNSVSITPKPTIKKECNVVDVDRVYNAAISHIKEYEGFRSEFYVDNDGSKTIGYGHHIKSSDNISEPISEEYATKILSIDLDKRISKAKRIHPGISETKAIAIGMFMFNCGSTRYIKSSMKKMVDEGTDPSKIWVKYCHFKLNGKTRKHPKLLARRKFEIKVYNYGNE